MKWKSAKEYANKPKINAKPNKYKLGLALSGGGARGFAHIGAFKAFAEHNINFDYVAGTSVGSIMGACYCAGYSYQQIADFAHTVYDRDIINSKLLKINNRASNIANVLSRLIGDITFQQLPIPLCVVAVDLISGNEVVLNSGNVAKACSASSAVPAIFTSVKIDNYNLVDGGLLNNIPSDVVRSMGAEYVVAIDLNHSRGEGTDSDKFWNKMGAVWRILMKATAFKGAMNSDIIIEPELRIFSNSTIANVDEMIEEGYRSTLNAIQEIKFMLGK